MARLRPLAFSALCGVVVAFALPLAACTTASLQDAMPATAEARSSPAEGVAPPSSAYTGPDGYPDLNVPMQAAAPQITDEDFAATSAALRARRDGLAARASGPGMSAADLRRIAGSHGERTLDAIEGQ
ncbi:hypothetical protein [Mesorhizobium sp. CAU 1741]|uniref:hypothetical protein n=1 Tax=Mesorhizobium sp. CAU 1741 TaxID=3140366 RepID=UPI00325A6D09